MDWQFERVGGPLGSTATEGPVWEGRTLLFTDRDNHLIRGNYPETGRFEEYLPSNAPSGLAFDRDGLIYACEGQMTRRDEEGRWLASSLSTRPPDLTPLAAFSRATG